MQARSVIAMADTDETYNMNQLATMLGVCRRTIFRRRDSSPLA